MFFRPRRVFHISLIVIIPLCVIAFAWRHDWQTPADTSTKWPVRSIPGSSVWFEWLERNRLSGSPVPAFIDLARVSNGGNGNSDSMELKRKKRAPGLEFRRLTLRDEKGGVPIDGLQKARQQMERMRLLQNAKARAAGKDPNKEEMAGLDPAAWAWLGPGNIGGRVRSINIDPNYPLNMLAGSVSGGIWRTSNAGVSWLPVNDFMANLAVATIVRNPNTPTLLYAGTGEGYGFGDDLSGGGVFRSTDSGATWILLASANPAAPAPPAGTCGVALPPCPVFWQYVNRLAISPDGGTMLAATGITTSTSANRPISTGAGNSGGIARSNDGGATWTQITNIVAQDVDFDPSNGLNAIVAELTDCGGGAPTPACPIQGSVRRSTDGGQTWNAATFNPAIINANLSTNGRVELAYANSSPNIIYASVNQNLGDVYQSTDSGQTFNRVYPNAGTATPINLLNNGWYNNALWVNPNDPTFLIVGGVNLYQTGDSGATFTIKANGGNASAHADHHVIVSHPQFNNTTQKSVYFGNDGGIYRVDDIADFSIAHGWTELNNNLGITQFYGGTVSFNGLIFGGTQDNGTVKVPRTGDFNPPYNPESWSDFAGGDGGYVAADPTDPSFLYGERQNMAIFRSTDGGNSVSLINGGISDTASANFIAPFILDPTDPNTLLAGSLNLWRCTNAKATTPTWTIAKCPTTAPNNANQQISAIAVSPSNTDFVVVGHNDGQIYMTLDGNCISDGTCAPGAACPNSPTWTQINTPATPGRFVTRLAIDNTRAPNWIYATFGGFSNNNVWVTRDLGTTWIDASGNGATSLPGVPVRSIIINPAVPDNLYVGTEVGIFASEDAGATWLLPHGGPANVSVDELFWINGDLAAATHGRGAYKTHVPVIDTVRCVAPVNPPCTCFGNWDCPCTWGNGQIPNANSDVYLTCPVTVRGPANFARNLSVPAGTVVTLSNAGFSSANLSVGEDLRNGGLIQTGEGFSQIIIVGGDLSNYRPRPAVTTAGVIQLNGSINVGGAVANNGIMALASDLRSKGYSSDSASTLTFNRLFVEGDVFHNGLLQDNGLLLAQFTAEFKSTPGQISTFSGSGVFRGPHGTIVGTSSFRMESDVTLGFDEFRNSGTLDAQNRTLTFSGNSFSNLRATVNDLGILGTGIVAMAPSDGTSTFVSDVNTQPQFTPRLQIASGTVTVSAFSLNELVVDNGATMNSDIVNVNGNMTVNGAIAPLGSGVLNFNGNSLTNNGAIGNLFFLNFNRSGSPRTQSIGGTGTWAPQNVQVGLYPPSMSTTTLSLDNDITFTTNSFIVSQGSTLNLSFRDLILAGPTNLVDDGTINGPLGTLRMEASGAGGSIRFTPNVVFQPTLEISTGQVRVHPGSSFLLLKRDLRINNGATFTMTGPNFVVERNVLNNGTINILAGTPFAVFEHRGPIFTNNGAISGTNLIFRFGPGVGGPFTHQLNGTGSWSAMEQILVNSGSTLELLNDFTYSGNSLFLLGSLNTGVNTLSLPCTTSWGGPGEAFGNIRRTNLSACPGASTFGNPFTTIQFTGGTAPFEVAVNVLPAPPAGFPGAASRSYLITPVGGIGYTATLRLHYLDSELNGNDESMLQLWRNNGTSWTPQGVTNRNTTQNWVEYAGVTQFSPWALSQLAPTAAGVSIGGRVLNGFRGVAGSRVSITNANGEVRTVITNVFGYFRFDNVPAGKSYVVSVLAKRFSFAPRLIEVNDDIVDLNFVAIEK